MNRQLKIWTVLISMVAMGLPEYGHAQKRQLQKADRQYEGLRYINAREIYLRLAEKGRANAEVLTKLGNTYYFNAEYAEAEKWYSELMESGDSLPDPIVHLRYAQTLKAMGREEASKRYFDEYLAESGRSEAQGFTADDYTELIQLNSGRYDYGAVEELYDADQITYGHTVRDNKLVYATTEEQVNTFMNTVDAWSGMSYLSLYEVEVDSTNHITGKPHKLKGRIGGRFHQSSATFGPDGKTMYYTRSNYTGEDGKNKERGVNLKIYRAHRNDKGDWGAVEDLKINSEEYSNAHPSMNADGSKLYFASDRPGGYGETDIWEVEVDSTGRLGEVKNLGPGINTGGRESFPYMARDSVLYFASDGHYGLGGLDVFAIRLKPDGNFAHLLNLGEPINSSADDFSYGIDEQTKYGFFSSDRSMEGDTSFVRTNIYSFRENSPLTNPYIAIITGCVTDMDTGEPLPGSTITLTEQKDNAPYGQLTTDERGCYRTEVERYDTYLVRAEKEDYDTDEKLSEAGLAEQTIDFALRRNRVKLEPGVDLAEVLNIPMIYFDFDRSDIRPDAETDLHKVLEVMKEYPDIRINIRSHTDSRGSDAYNKALSERRASSTRQWLLDHGVEGSRLTSEGLGETELTNECSNGVPCTKEQHQANRRSEFIIIE